MSRRKGAEEIEFGSDSFLDVVANIVGILIILIVVAGIKAGQSAVSPERVADFLQKHPASPQPAIRSLPKTAQEPAPQASPHFVAQSERLRADLTALKTAAQLAASQGDQLGRQEAELKQQIETAQQTVQVESNELKRKERQLADAQSRLEQQKTGLRQLEVDVQNVENEKTPVKTIKHRLTPLSQEIRGKEIHFRLLNDKVAYLPISELTERLRPKIAEQRQRLIHQGIQRGQAGPVAGFHMDYIVEVEKLSAVEELRQGTSMMIGVSEWRIVAEPDLESETADEALKVGSDFLTRLRAADPDSNITIWVYPDSFGLYRRLQEFAHQENFTVAARPLPFNVPITFSSRGSRSSGQ
jgi:hypothetical protein